MMPEGAMSTQENGKVWLLRLRERFILRRRDASYSKDRTFPGETLAIRCLDREKGKHGMDTVVPKIGSIERRDIVPRTRSDMSRTKPQENKNSKKELRNY